MDRFEEDKRLWYEGLGEAYAATKPLSEGFGTVNNPKWRLPVYRTASIVFSGSALYILILMATAKNLPVYGLILFVPLALTLLWIGYRYNGLASGLKRALDQGLDPDANDALRRRTMENAVKWGMKKGLVKEESGRLVFKKAMT